MKNIDLRDYFAIKALASLLVNEESYEETKLRHEDYQEYCENYAESAYCFADAMLAAREN